MPTYSQILSKLDLERLILVLGTHTIKTVIESSHIFGPNVYALAFLRIYSLAPVVGLEETVYKRVLLNVNID